jgi:hypothetical protein
MAAAGRLVEWIAVAALGLFTAFAAMFAAGEAIADPGGLPAVTLLTLWALPLIALGACAYSRPDRTSSVLLGLLVIAAGAQGWAARAEGGWQSIDANVGPVRSILTLALAGVLGLFALKRPQRGAVMLLVLGALPYVAGRLVGAADTVQLSAVDHSALVTGAVVLVGAWLQAPPHAPPALHPAIGRAPERV